jgi:hypothetical protein
MTGALDVLFSHAKGGTYCSICGNVIPDDEPRLRFIDDFVASICGPCRCDFERINSETIEAALQRRQCHPADLLQWRGGRPRS